MEDVGKISPYSLQFAVESILQPNATVDTNLLGWSVLRLRKVQAEPFLQVPNMPDGVDKYRSSPVRRACEHALKSYLQPFLDEGLTRPPGGGKTS